MSNDKNETPQNKPLEASQTHYGDYRDLPLIDTTNPR
mgnify:FL=1